MDIIAVTQQIKQLRRKPEKNPGSVKVTRTNDHVIAHARALPTELSREMGAGTRFSKVPKLYGPFSRVTIPSVGFCYLGNMLKARLS